VSTPWRHPWHPRHLRHLRHHRHRVDTVSAAVGNLGTFGSLEIIVHLAESAVQVVLKSSIIDIYVYYGVATCEWCSTLT
jgi:hypothetical protein